MYFDFQLSLTMLKMVTACIVAHSNEIFVEEAEDFGIAGREAGHWGPDHFAVAPAFLLSKSTLACRHWKVQIMMRGETRALRLRVACTMG